MMKQQSGFTLIELIMVIVVLGALAVTALPKYVDLEASAQQGAVEGIAGAMSAGAAINFSACKAGMLAPDCLATWANCTDTPTTVEGGIPAGYNITGGAFVAGTPHTCTITGNNTDIPNTITTDYLVLVP